MRRLPRIPSSVSGLPGVSGTSCSLPAPFVPPSACVLAARDLSTGRQTAPDPLSTSPRTTHRSRKFWPPSRQQQTRCYAANYRFVTEHPRDTSNYPTEVQLEGDELKYPGRRSRVPAPADVDDPLYSPARNGDGLEEIGGLRGWWDQPGHWGEAHTFRGFGPDAKTTDPAKVTAVARRAVVEALSILAREPDSKRQKRLMVRAWPSGSPDQMVSALRFPLEVDAAGNVRFENTEERNAHLGAIRDAVCADGEQVADSPAEYSEEAWTDILALSNSWNDGWKRISLSHPMLKFAVTKRIQQLTGLVVPDAKLLHVEDVGALLRLLVRPPKPKTLAEELEKKRGLQPLPNVSMYKRRVTHIDKHKMVGRWKVIVNELEKRDLPVIGMGDYRKTKEETWIKGGM